MPNSKIRYALTDEAYRLFLMPGSLGEFAYANFLNIGNLKRLSHALGRQITINDMLLLAYTQERYVMCSVERISFQPISFVDIRGDVGIWAVVRCLQQGIRVPNSCIALHCSIYNTVDGYQIPLSGCIYELKGYYAAQKESPSPLGRAWHSDGKDIPKLDDVKVHLSAPKKPQQPEVRPVQPSVVKKRSGINHRTPAFEAALERRLTYTA